MNSHIRSVVDRLAGDGYCALAPDVFWRVEPEIELGYQPDDVAKGRALKQQMNLDQVVQDIDASFSALAERPECRGRAAEF